MPRTRGATCDPACWRLSCGVNPLFRWIIYPNWPTTPSVLAGFASISTCQPCATLLTASAIATRPCINGYALSIQPTAQSLAARELFAGWRRTTWSRVILMVWRLRRWTFSSWHAAKLRLMHVFFPLGFLALVRAGSSGPAIRLSGGLHVTRQRSGAGRAPVAEDGGSGDHCRNQLPAEIVGRARPR